MIRLWMHLLKPKKAFARSATFSPSVALCGNGLLINCCVGSGVGRACSGSGPPGGVFYAERGRPSKPSYTAGGSGPEAPWLKLHTGEEKRTTNTRLCLQRFKGLGSRTCDGFQDLGFDVLKLQDGLQRRLHLRIVQLGTSFKLIQQQQRVCRVRREVSWK